MPIIVACGAPSFTVLFVLAATMLLILLTDFTV